MQRFRNIFFPPKELEVPKNLERGKIWSPDGGLYRLQPEWRDWSDETELKKESVREVGQRRISAAVGWAAIALPVLILIFSLCGVLPNLPSISHYYYSALFGGIFVGILVFCGTFLLGYSGQTHHELRATALMGAALIFVAYFPTNPAPLISMDDAPVRFFGKLDIEGFLDDFLNKTPLTSEDLNGVKSSFSSLHTPYSSTFHSLSAFIFFLALFAYVSLVMTRYDFNKYEINTAKPARTGYVWRKIPQVKRIRNMIYFLSSIGFLIAGILIVIGEVRGSEQGIDTFLRGQETYWAEVFILVPFGVAWTIKSRPFNLLRDPHEIPDR